MFSLQILILCTTSGLIFGNKDLSGKQCVCGLENTQSRVFYGNEVDHHKYPWLAHIKMDKNGGTSMCGGSLIDSRRILTAAHCVHNRTNHKIPASAIRVYLGVQHLGEAGRSIVANRVSHYETGEYYPTYYGYDIALLVLEKPVKFTRTVSPICISVSDHDSYLKNRRLTVAGWGISHHEPDRSDPQKKVLAPSLVPMESEVDFVTKEQCADIYGRKGIDSSRKMDARLEICAYNFETHADACAGDSGGPLMYKNSRDNRWYLAGVVARGPDCPNHSGIPGKYTKLQSIGDLIKNMDAPKDFCLN